MTTVSYIDPSMWELFRADLETQMLLLDQGLVSLEQGEHKAETLESLMRAAHSIKGAAKVMQLDSLVHLAHAVEDCFVAIQEKKMALDSNLIDIILKIVDFLKQLSLLLPEQIVKKIKDEQSTINEFIAALQTPGSTSFKKSALTLEKLSSQNKIQNRVLRVTAQNLNRLMGLAGESLVESRWLQPFGHSLLKIKAGLNEVSLYLNYVREILEGKDLNERAEHYLIEVQHKTNEGIQNLSDCMTELEMFILRHSSLSDRLYREVVDSRMRPFADGVEGFPRLVRDLAKELNKKIHFEIVGKNTPVDREVLEKLEAPLSHLLRNAIDHGIESPEIRIKEGKPSEGNIKLEAEHRAGMLSITVTDDGKGVDTEQLRKKIIEMNLVAPNIAATLTENELFDFLFLPGFSTALAVTELSGRGIGLNVVQTMLQEVGGTIRVFSQPGKGMRFNLLLPLTLSVIRALIVEISGEPYAFPLTRLDRTLSVPNSQVEIIESKQYVSFHGQNIGLITAAQILELDEAKYQSDKNLSIIILSDSRSSYGIVVDKFLEERELVVQELDRRLGKVPDISSGALMEDGSPILIIDIEDMVRSIDRILSGNQLHKIVSPGNLAEVKKKKMILVIDDSITVREVESRLLQSQGYEVQTAVNGADGWNAVRGGNFDLVVTDTDMPRMGGIELIKLIRSEDKFKNLPVLIVSYKERDEDRLAGLEAGANYYLTKSSFHDETLIKAVNDLIGEA